MCIAIAKPIGVEIPNDDILTNCFNNNPDGAGFAFNHNNEVVIRKGYMKLKDFLDAFHKYDEKFNFKNRGVLIHTRITTHGGTNPQMCHPFPINSDEGALKKIEYCSPFAVVHNGIISLTSSEATKKQDMSDTAIFVQKYLTKIAKNKNWFNNKANIELIYELIEKGEKVRILSASPNKRADKDKRKWLKKYVPIIKRKNIIFCRLGDNKADYAKKKNINILLDDYSVNCREWAKRGENFKAIKVGDSPIDL